MNDAGAAISRRTGVCGLHTFSCPSTPDLNAMSSFAPDPAHADAGTPPDSASTDSGHQLPADNAELDPDAANKKKKGSKRRKVNHACLYCRRSHMTCDEGRPCQRW